MFLKYTVNILSSCFLIPSLLFCVSCGGFKYQLARKTSNLKLYYIDSKKIGKRVKAELVSNNQLTEYNIYLGYEGLPLHIIKYAPGSKTSSKDELDFSRSQQFLVTDTLKNRPNYMGNEVNGYYYDPSIINKLENLPKIVSRVSPDEYAMFGEIEKLLYEKKIAFQPVNPAKVTGWFRYKF